MCSFMGCLSKLLKILVSSSPFVYNSFNMNNHNGLYSPADKPVTRYISSFWNCLKVALTAKSTHRANNSTLLSQCELLTVFLQELTFCQYKTSYYLKNLYILTILLKFTNIVLSISNLKNRTNKTHTHKDDSITKYRRKYRKIWFSRHC